MTKSKKAAVALPVVKDPVVDRLTFIVPWGLGSLYLAGQTDKFAKVEAQVQEMKEEGLCEMWRAKGRYRLHARITLPGGAKARVALGARDPGIQKGGIRVELNPSQLVPGDAEHLHSFIRRAVGPAYDKHLLNSIVNRIDAAVDVENAHLNEFVIDYHGAHEATVFGTRLKMGGRIETLNFGSVSSSFRTTVYSKSKERVDKAIKKLLKERKGADLLKNNLVRQVKAAKDLPPTVRVEVRGMKICKPVYELKAAGKKRFERFSISELAGVDALDPFVRTPFLAMVRQDGLRAAIAHYKGKPEHKIMKAIVERPASWWVPQGLWVRSIKTLKASGIFPKEAFKRPEDR